MLAQGDSPGLSPANRFLVSYCEISSDGEAGLPPVIARPCTNLGCSAPRGAVDALAAEIEEAFLAHPSGELLASMPGIGPRTGAPVLAEISDGSHPFSQSASLAGVPGV